MSEKVKEQRVEIPLHIGNYGSEMDSHPGCRSRASAPRPEHHPLRLLGSGLSCPRRIQEPDLPAFCVCPCSLCHQTLCHTLVTVAGAAAAAAARGAVRNVERREVTPPPPSSASIGRC